MNTMTVAACPVSCNRQAAALHPDDPLRWIVIGICCHNQCRRVDARSSLPAIAFFITGSFPSIQPRAAQMPMSGSTVDLQLERQALVASLPVLLGLGVSVLIRIIARSVLASIPILCIIY